MRRKSRGWVCALHLLILFALFLSACGGGNKPVNTVGPPATVTLNPPLVSFNPGDVMQTTVSVLDAQGRSVFSQTVTFNSNNPNIQIANNGLLCAGTWDSLTSPVVCTPAVTGNNGLQASITATAGTITSAVVSVFVHIRVTSIVVTPSSPACVPQAGTVQFKATAMNGTNDITPSVGQINWQILTGQVATGTPLSTPPATTGGGSEPITVTAKLPGKTQIVATANTVSVVTSLPATFTECPVAKITLSAPNTTLSGAGATVQLTAVATDTTGAEVTSPPTNFSAPTLTSASNPSAVATVNSTGLVTGQFPGTAAIVAACIPNTCNINLEPVYSEVIPITVSGTSATTAYAASKDSSSLIPINTTNNTAGTAITLPNNQKPNSLLFSPTGARAFLGSDGGMMIIDANANTVAANVTNAPGKVLAVSPDGNQALVADVTAGLLRLFNGTANTITNFNVLKVAAAAYSPDGSKAYIVAGDNISDGNRLVVLQASTISTFPLSPAATDISVLANGNAAYLANSNTSRVLACNNSIANGPGGTPKLVGAIPNGKQILGVNDSDIDAIDVAITAAAGSSASACPTVSETRVPHAAGSTAAPVQLILSSDGTKAFVTSRDRTGSLLAYDVGTDAAAGSPSTIPLTDGTVGTTTGGITPDSKTLYVGGTDKKIHVIDIATGTETAQVPATGDLTFTPDFVAVRPR